METQFFNALAQFVGENWAGVYRSGLHRRVCSGADAYGPAD